MRAETRGIAALALLLVLAGTRAAGAETTELVLDPERTTVRFELDSTLHAIEGVARMEGGALRFDPAGGDAEGRIVIDATSLESGNALRDGQMHGKVLESEAFPSIAFVAERLAVESREADSARVTVSGTLHMHGGAWPLQIPAQVSTQGDGLRVEGSFVIPYVEWGMRDMSNFLLHVDPEVRVHFESSGSVSPRIAGVAGGRAPSREVPGEAGVER